MKPAIFLDRDGTLIEDTGYPNDPAKVELLPGVPDALRLLKQKGYLLHLVSNQSGVGRGLISHDQFKAVHEKFDSLLTLEGLALDGISYCLHHPNENCMCRKPRTGNIPKIIQSMPVIFTKSYVVGDREADVMLAKNLVCNSALVLTGYGKTTLKDFEEKNISGIYTPFNTLAEFAESIPTFH